MCRRAFVCLNDCMHARMFACACVCMYYVCVHAHLYSQIRAYCVGALPDLGRVLGRRSRPNRWRAFFLYFYRILSKYYKKTEMYRKMSITKHSTSIEHNKTHVVLCTSMIKTLKPMLVDVTLWQAK